MPISVDPNARLSACQHCMRVFLHLPDTVNPTLGHEASCEKSPHYTGPVNFPAATSTNSLTFTASQKTIDVYLPPLGLPT